MGASEESRSADLSDFDVPVAELVPDEIVDVLLGVAESEGREGAGDVFNGAVESAEYPAVFNGEEVGGLR